MSCISGSHEVPTSTNFGSRHTTGAAWTIVESLVYVEVTVYAKRLLTLRTYVNLERERYDILAKRERDDTVSKYRGNEQN